MKLQDLEKYRNDKGFIDFDKVLELYKFGDIQGFSEGLLETRGSAEKFKHWYELEDCDILARSTMFVGDIATYTEYAELITEELAKQVGIPCAHYDLIKVNGINGNISVNIIEDENKQSLTALSQNQASLDVMRGSTIDEVFEKIRYFSITQGVKKEGIKRINNDLVKRIIFDIYTMQTDRHLGNISLLYDGDELILSPLYDNECSLMLDKTQQEINEILQSSNKEKDIEIYASLQEGCINLCDEDKTQGCTGWEDVLYFLCDEPGVSREFAKECSKKLNIEKAIQSVEARIKAEIPKEAKEFAILGFNTRKRAIETSLMIDFDNGMGDFDSHDDEYPI